MAFARGNFFLRFRPSLLCDLRLFEWRVVLREGLLDLVTRAVRDHSNDLNLLVFSADNTLKDLIGLDGRWSVWDPSERFDWTRRKMVRLKSTQRIWLYETEDGPSEVHPKESDWTKKESGPYDDVSNLYVLPEWSDWTRQISSVWCSCLLCSSDWLIRCICLLETLLIGWFDGSVLWRLVLTYFYLLFRDFIQPFAINKKRFANASSFCVEYAVQSAVDVRNRQNDRHLCYLLYPCWSFKTVHYANDVAR